MTEREHLLRLGLLLGSEAVPAFARPQRSVLRVLLDRAQGVRAERMSLGGGQPHVPDPPAENPPARPRNRVPRPPAGASPPPPRLVQSRGPGHLPRRSE